MVLPGVIMKKFLKNFFALSLAVSFYGCAGSNSNGLPKHIDFENYNPAEETMLAEEFGLMDSLSQIGWILAGQDGVAWVASDSLQVDLPKDLKVGFAGWVAQGDLRNGFCIFYGEDSTGLYQIARYDFSANGMIRAIGRTDLPEGKIGDLVKMNHSAFNHFKNSGAAYNVQYNTYIMENEGKYTFYAIPGSTATHVVFGGGVKLTSSDSTWNVELLHKSPIAMRWEAVTNGNKPVRTSSMGNLLNEVDFAQYYIYRKSIPDQYIKTLKYLIGLMTNKDGEMAIFVVK